MLPPSTLGWVAGILDLKGRITYKNNKQRATRQIVLSVETKDQRITDRLSTLTGTHPEYQAAQYMPEWMRRGCREHCPENHVHVHRHPQHMPAVIRWTITGAGAAILIHNLNPYLLTNYDTVYNEIIENTKTRLEGQGSGMIWTAIYRLHELGWELPPPYNTTTTEPGQWRYAPPWATTNGAT